MEKIRIFSVWMMALILTSCNNLDLNPLSESSTGNFYSNQQELEMAINDLYRSPFFAELTLSSDSSHIRRPSRSRRRRQV